METIANNILSKALLEESEVGRLTKKVAIVVGGSRAGNMGQAIAQRFLDEGATGWCQAAASRAGMPLRGAPVQMP
jgi:hypothetical protein